MLFLIFKENREAQCRVALLRGAALSPSDVSSGSFVARPFPYQPATAFTPQSAEGHAVELAMSPPLGLTLARKVSLQREEPYLVCCAFSHL